MNRMKRIQKDIRMGWTLRAVFFAVIVTGLIWLIMLGMGELRRMRLLLIVFAGIFLISIVTGLLVGSFKAHRAKKSVASMGSDFESDQFEKAGDCLYVGDMWMVYHHKEDWLFWRKDAVFRIMLRDHNGLGTRADISVYKKGSYAGTTFRLNGTSYDMLQRIENWADGYTE